METLPRHHGRLVILGCIDISPHFAFAPPSVAASF